MPVSKSAANIPENLALAISIFRSMGKIEVQWDIHQDDGTVKSLWWEQHIGASEEQGEKKESENVKGTNNNIDELKNKLQHEIFYQASHGFESEKG